MLTTISWWKSLRRVDHRLNLSAVEAFRKAAKVPYHPNFVRSISETITEQQQSNGQSESQDDNSWLKQITHELGIKKPRRNLGTFLDPFKDKLNGLNLYLLLNTLGKGREKERVCLGVFKWAKEAGKDLDAHHYSTVISSLGKNNNLPMAAQMFEESKLAGVEPAKYAFTSMMNAYVRNSKFEEAESVFNQMEQIGGELTPGTVAYNILVSAAGQAGNWEKAVQLMQEMRARDVELRNSTYGSLISGLSRQGMWQEALKVLDRMEEDGYPTNAITYSKLIDVLAKAGQVHQADQVFEQMKLKGVLPYEYTYTALISARSRTQSADELKTAWGLLEEMMAAGVEPSVHTFNSLMAVCASARQPRQALKVKGMMEAAGLEPTVDSYCALVEAWLRSGKRWEVEAFRTVKSMRARGLVPNIKIYHLLMGAYQKNKGQEKRVWSLVDEMRADGVSPDFYTYSSLITVFSKATLINEAFKALNLMEEASITPNAPIYDMLLSACERGGQAHRALMLLEKMRQNEIAPTQENYRVVLRTCELDLRNGIKRGWQALREMIGEKVPRDTQVYNSLLRAREEHVEQVFEVLEVMMGDGCEPDSDSYNSLVAAYYKAGQTHHCFDVLREMQVKGLEPNRDTYKSFKSLCLETDDPVSQAWDLLREMESQDLKLNVDFFNSLLKVFQMQNRADEAQKMWKEMEKQGVEPVTTSYNILLLTYLQGQQMNEAFQTLDLMIESESVSPTLFTYKHMISKLESVDSDSQHVWKITKAISADRTPVDIKECHSLIRMFSDKEDHRGILEVIALMDEVGRKHNLFSYNAAIGAYSHLKQAEPALDMFNKMRQQSVLPDSSTYSALIRACEHSEEKDFSLVIKAIREGSPPDVSVYNALITACEGAGQWKQALEVLHEMQAAGAQLEST